MTVTAMLHRQKDRKKKKTREICIYYKYDDQRRKPLIAGLVTGVTGVVEVRPARIVVLDRRRPVTERALEAMMRRFMEVAPLGISIP